MLNTFYVITDTSVASEDNNAFLVTGIYSDTVITNRLTYIDREVIRTYSLHNAKQIAALCNYIAGERKFGVLEIQFAVYFDIDAEYSAQESDNA